MTRKIYLDEGFFGTKIGEITDDGRLFLRDESGRERLYGYVEQDGIYVEKGLYSKEKVISFGRYGDMYLTRDEGIFTYGTKVGSLGDLGSIYDADGRRIGEITQGDRDMGGVSPSDRSTRDANPDRQSTVSSTGTGTYAPRPSDPGPVGIDPSVLIGGLLVGFFAVGGVVLFPALLGSSSVTSGSKIILLAIAAVCILAGCIAGALTKETKLANLYMDIYWPSWLGSELTFNILSFIYDKPNGWEMLLLIVGGGVFSLGWAAVGAAVATAITLIVRKASASGRD